MKKFILIFMLCSIAGFTFSQYAAFFDSRGKDKQLSAPMVRSSVGGEVIPGQQPANEYVSALKTVLADPTIMTTYYDLQTNISSGQQRIYQFPDGSMGGVATMSHTATGSSWPDRGTGYNYSADQGTTWLTPPATRVENGIRTGWPSYQPWGSNGECILAHQFPTGNLILSTRSTKGTGSWTTTNSLAPPSGVPAMAWPRMVTNGTNHMNIHVIAVTEPTANGGNPYHNMDGCLLYASSTDGGATWGSGWQQLPGTTSSEYLAFSADQYTWALPHGDTLAFVVGNQYMDEFVMKSTDNGSTWTKTVVYNSPYNLTGQPASGNGFYTDDGTSAIALDYYGNVHILFGLMRDSTTQYFPNTNGLIYWNETMPQLPQSLDPDTLYNHGNMIAWQLDTSVFYKAGQTNLPFASYYTSLTSNPGILIDHNNNIYVIWSSVTHWKDNSSLKLYMRHVFERDGTVGPDGSFFFHSAFTDLNSDFVYNFLECMYADISQSSYDDKLHILFQGDTYAGSYVKDLNNPNATGQTVATNNSLIVLNPLKPLNLGVNNKQGNISMEVSVNYPNPFHGGTSITVSNPKPGNMSIEVINLVGQRISLVNYGFINAGSGNYSMDGSGLGPGVYFYRVKVDNETVTKKMVVE